MVEVKNGIYTGNCKYCISDLSLNFVSCFKTSNEDKFYFCSLGHFWMEEVNRELPTNIFDIQSSTSNIAEKIQPKPFNRDRDKPFNRDRDKPFNRDRDKPFNRDRDKPFNRDRDKPFNRD
ncbi:MAG: hypothetical protein ACE5SW_09975, partial [Nitrososphaeraceae archaeon]